jgi:TolB-like protein/DNA-binding winged helix-turn-helix (wHTH) protein
MARRYRFDDLEIDLDSFRLSKAGANVAIEPKALNLLIFLVENRGRLLTRREVISAVWGNAFVTDHVLNRAIGQLRKLLPDDPKEPRYIETVPTLGYRFIGNLELEEPAASNESKLPSAPETAEVPSTDGVRSLEVSPDSPPQISLVKRRPVVLATAIALAAVFCGVALSSMSRWWRPTGATQIHSLVVLPLDDLSSDPQQYLADGMTDELIIGLGRLSALRVVSRTTALQYRSTKKPLPQIARELGVDAVIEGSVLRVGSRVRISAQLFSASSEKQLWGQSYEGDLRDVMSLQNQVAGSVASEVRINLTPSEQSRIAETQRVNPQAYEELLRGNYFFAGNEPEAMKKALAHYNQALAFDPNFARAYVGVARSYNLLGEGVVPSGEAMAAADAATAKALQLEPDLPEAYAERAWTLLFYHWDFPGTARDFRHALDLDPNLSDAHEGYADYLVAQGRFDEGVAEMRKARDLDPLSPFMLTDFCNLLVMAHRFADAEVQCAAALDLDPHYPWALGTIGDVYALEGKYEEADKAYNKSWGCDRACADAVDEAAGRPGRTGKFEAWLPHTEFTKPEFAFELAQAFAGLGRNDKVFTLLDSAYAQRIAMHGFVYLAVDPHFDKVRSDPRFNSFLRRSGLPPQPHGLAKTL